MENQAEIGSIQPGKLQRFYNGVLAVLPLLTIIVSIAAFIIATRDSYRDAQKDFSIQIQQLQEKDKAFEAEQKERRELRDRERDELRGDMKSLREQLPTRQQYDDLKTELFYQRGLLEKILMNQR